MQFQRRSTEAKCSECHQNDRRDPIPTKDALSRSAGFGSCHLRNFTACPLIATRRNATLRAMIKRGPILIIGGASVDRVRAEGEPMSTPGGAGLFTALAARQAGANVRFFGFRPDPLPELFAKPASLVPWQGPPCAIEDLPHFEIVYEQDGNARLAAANWGREETLDPSMIGDSLLDSPLIHIAAIHAPELQMHFVKSLRSRCEARRYIDGERRRTRSKS